MRTATVSLLIVLLVGCMHYGHPVADDGDGHAGRLPFVYGNFCGPGWPLPPLGLNRHIGEGRREWKMRTWDGAPSNAQWRERIRDDAESRAGERRLKLGSMPPSDSVDALCYAHDYCYELSTDHASCDVALRKGLIAYANGMPEKTGCGTLVNDMTIAFFGKPWARSSDAASTYGNRAAQLFVGLPAALFLGAVTLPAKPFITKPPDNTGGVVGVCRVEGKTNDDVVREFEAAFQSAPLRRPRRGEPPPMPIRIPLPRS